MNLSVRGYECADFGLSQFFVIIAELLAESGGGKSRQRAAISIGSPRKLEFEPNDVQLCTTAGPADELNQLLDS